MAYHRRSRRDLDKIVERLNLAGGRTWTLRHGRLVTSHLRGGRIFYVDMRCQASAYTCASMSDGRYFDLRCHAVMGNEEDIGAWILRQAREADDDPRNAGLYWPAVGGA